MRLYAHWASTTRVFSASSPSRAIRVPSKTSATSRARPLRVTALTEGAIRSTKVAAPGRSPANRMVVTDRKVRGPSPVTSPSAERRSSATS